MKKLLVVLMSLLMLFTLVGCGGGDEGGEEKKDALRVVVMPAYVQEEWSQTIIKSAQAACDYYGYELTMMDPNFDVATQIACMEDVMSGGYDAVIIQSVNGSALIEKCKELVDAGIIVVDFDCLIAETGSIVSPATASVKADDQGGGATAFELIREECGDEGTIFVLEETPGVDTGLFRNSGLEEAAKAYPGYTIIKQRATGDGDGRALNKDLIIDWTTTHPEITACFSYYGDGAIGLYEGLKEAGRQDIKVVGYDATADQIDAMKSDPNCSLIATIANAPGMLGGAAIDIVHGIVEYGYAKKAPDDVFQLENAVLKKSEMDTYTDPFWTEPIYTEEDFK